jgi:hypothetical protein
MVTKQGRQRDKRSYRDILSVLGSAASVSESINLAMAAGFVLLGLPGRPPTHGLLDESRRCRCTRWRMPKWNR